MVVWAQPQPQYNPFTYRDTMKEINKSDALRVLIQSEIKRCKTMEDIMHPDGLIKQLSKHLIEGMLAAELEQHRWLRKFTKSKAVFPNNEALLKQLYFITKNVKMANTAFGWRDEILPTLSIIFGERIIMFFD
jgi:hypothetical protein